MIPILSWMRRLISQLLILNFLAQPLLGTLSYAESADQECSGFFARLFKIEARRQSFETMKALNGKSVQEYFPKGEPVTQASLDAFKKDFDQLMDHRSRFENFPAEKVRDFLKAKTGSPYPSLDSMMIEQIYQKDHLTLRELQDFALLNSVEDSITSRKELAEALSGRSASELASLASKYGKKFALGFWDKTWGFVTFSAVTTMIIPFWSMISTPFSNYLKQITPDYEKAKQTRSELSTLTHELQKEEFRADGNPDTTQRDLQKWQEYEKKYADLYGRLRQQLTTNAGSSGASSVNSGNNEILFTTALSALDAQDRGDTEARAIGVPTETETQKIAVLADWKLAALTNPDLVVSGSISDGILARDIESLAHRGLFKLFIKELSGKISASLAQSS